ncbi:tumor necrosis factor ligand superfamily member 13B-like isoform X4 [Alligator sinensis]|uniref:Tumor necrosis factor ligand superfamily member 13B-like isoform X4 n=1 Tax=Alligator sinensis TaxID=38654 RepID=A0A1U8DXF2_ALLSI|nr:tumor necrosis factor ligand superfamily member 13B-like isoform X4 [Alligator sinensis]
MHVAWPWGEISRGLIINPPPGPGPGPGGTREQEAVTGESTRRGGRLGASQGSQVSWLCPKPSRAGGNRHPDTAPPPPGTQDPAEDPGIQSMRTHTDEHPRGHTHMHALPWCLGQMPPQVSRTHMHMCTAQVSPRSRRQLERPSPSPGPRHQHRQRTALHLVPSHCSTNAEGDVTELWWAPALGQGHGLELSGSIVTVRQAGLYLVYSQVLFHDPTFTMGQVLWRLPPGGQGPGQILLRCVQSMPGQREQAYNSCYSGGAFHLQRGEGLRLAGPRANASLDLTPHGTFLGLVRL